MTNQCNVSGGVKTSNPLYLIDLEGNIIDNFDSGLDLADFLGRKIITYSNINTKSISKKKYRIVTPSFYDNNLSLIKSWNNFSNKTLHSSREYNKIKYELHIKGSVKRLVHIREIAEQVGCSYESIRVNIKWMKRIRTKNQKFTSKSVDYRLILL